jgi:hypothetical protein
LDFFLGGRRTSFTREFAQMNWWNNEKRLHPPEITVKLELLHRFDIWIGTGFLMFTTCRALAKIYRNPADH